MFLTMIVPAGRGSFIFNTALAAALEPVINASQARRDGRYP